MTRSNRFAFERPPQTRDPSQHGGMQRPDDEAITERTRAERVDAGLRPYDPDTVPGAADAAPRVDITRTAPYEEAAAEVRRQVRAGRLAADRDLPRRERTARRPFPPTGYGR